MDPNQQPVSSDTPQVVQPQQAAPLQPPLQSPIPPHPHHRIYAYVGLSLIGIIIVVLIGGVFLMPKKMKSVSTQQGEVTKTNNTTAASPQPTTGSVVYKVQPLSALKGSPSNTTALPLGDNKYTTDGPKKGYIYLCNAHQGFGGAQADGPWIHGATWSSKDKVSISGQVFWPSAEFKNTVNGNSRILAGNDLPKDIATGIFPVATTDPAYTYDKNPNSIITQRYSDTFPVDPTYEQTPSCMGGEVGIMLDGVALFNGFDAGLRDAAAHEVQDSCSGHPQESGEYHYHSLSSCFKDIQASTVLGFALDGFPITGPVLPDGNYLTTNDLDECHGITSEIMLDGKQTSMYHYVMTQDFPYSVSCFRGKPVSMQVIQNEMQQQKNVVNAPSGDPHQMQLFNTVQPSQPPVQPQSPPQAAFSSCSGRSTGSSCTFNSPNELLSGTCKIPPGQSQLVCVPNSR